MPKTGKHLKQESSALEKFKAVAECVATGMNGMSTTERLNLRNEMLKVADEFFLNAALKAEMADHLGYGENEPPPAGQTNRRNGYSIKTVKTRIGKLLLHIPRDREGSFKPQVIRKYSRLLDEQTDPA